MFFISIVIVSGPTPRGTGVSAPGHLIDARVHVADEHAALLREPGQAWMAFGEERRHHLRVGHLVDADVHHRGAWLHEVGRDEAGPSHGRHQDVRLPARGREVGRARMAHRHRGVAVQQQERHRLADDVAAAEHHRPLARDLNLLALEHLDHARRRARHQLRPVLHQQADALGGKAVHVLAHGDGVEHLLRRARPHGLRQRRLHQDAVVLVALVQPLDLAQHVVEGRGRRHPRAVGVEADFLRRLQLVPHVARATPDPHRRARCRARAAARAPSRTPVLPA